MEECLLSRANCISQPVDLRLLSPAISALGPSPTVTQVQALPSTRLLPGARQGLGGGEKLVKRREAALCGQSKSAVRNTASAAGGTLGFRTPATEMVTVLTIPLLMCASDHHAGHLQYTCLLKNNIKQN